MDELFERFHPIRLVAVVALGAVRGRADEETDYTGHATAWCSIRCVACWIATSLANSTRELMSSFRKMWRKCASTV